MCIVSIAAKSILIGSAVLALMMAVSSRWVKDGNKENE